MQVQERPRFRQDLVAELIEEQGQRFIDVGDPDTGNTFRFYEVEYSLACAMDGERDVAGIMKWAQEELGVTPSPQEVRTVIATLADLRFIDTGAVVDRAAEMRAAAQHAAQTAQPAAAAAHAGGGASAARAPASKPAAQSARGVDVELGSPGTSPAPASRDLPETDDFTLGAPGAPAAAASARAPIEDIGLGTPGARPEPTRAPKAPASEVSIDLASHMPVRADDVKNAVKQSRVVPAVEPPADVEPAKPAARADKVEKATTPAKVDDIVKIKAEPKADKAAAKVEDKPAAKADDKKADDKKADDKAKAAKADKAAAKVEDKPAKAAKADDKAKAKPAVATPQPATDRPVARQGISPALVVVLILAIVGAGAFVAYKFLLSGEDAAPATSKVPPPKPTLPPPPATASAKVSTEKPVPQDVVTGPGGTIETIEAADKDVKTGDLIASLAGQKPLQAEIASLTKDVDKLQPGYDAAAKALSDAQQKPDNQRGVESAQKKVDKLKKPLDEKKAKLETKKTDLERMSIKAPADGKLVEPLKVGDKVGPAQVVAKIQRAETRVATFTIPPTMKIPADGNVTLQAGDKQVTCTVTDQQATTIKVSCPLDVAEGTELTLSLK